jgi:hypothetical protein
MGPASSEAENQGPKLKNERKDQGKDQGLTKLKLRTKSETYKDHFHRGTRE